MGFNDEKPAVIPPQMLQQQQQQHIVDGSNGQQLLLPQTAGGGGGGGGGNGQQPPAPGGSNGAQSNILRRSISGVSTGPMGKKTNQQMFRTSTLDAAYATVTTPHEYSNCSKT